MVKDGKVQEIFTPEEFSNEHSDIAKVVEDFIKRKIVSRSEDIEFLSYDLSRKLMKKTGVMN